MSDPTWENRPGSTAERPAPDVASRRGDEASGDDWLWDDIDWSEGAKPSSSEPPSVPQDAAEASGGPGSGDQSPVITARVALIRRRRIAALAVLGLVFVLALVIPLVVFGGGGNSAEQTTPPTTAAQTTTVALTPSPERPAATTTQSTTPETAPLRVALPAGQSLRQGDRGSAVVNLQKGLAALGFSTGEPDGVFGAITAAAVIDFQQSNDLPPDGIVGSDTVRLLNAALAKKGATG
jgi:hypothetical protein